MSGKEVRLRFCIPGLLAASVLLWALPSCAHPPLEEPPLYEDLLFAQMKRDKPKQKIPLPFDEFIEDEVPEKERSKPVVLSRPEVAQWQDFLDGNGSESVGKASKGRLASGRLMAEKGRGYFRKNDKAAYGTDESVAIVLWACARIVDMYPGTVPAVIGDLSAEKGGRLRPHSSHQSGRDVDIGYFFRDNREVTHFEDATPDNLDVEKTWTLIDLLLSTHQVEYLFIDRSLHEVLHREATTRGWDEEEIGKLFEAPLGKGKRTGVIRHQKGHRHHLHVRFVCPRGDERCE